MYERWIKSTPIILPRKLQIKEILEEPEQQTRVRQRNTMDTMNMEIELMKLRAENNEQKVKNIDEEMITEFKSKASGDLLDSITKLWKEECEIEEMNSLQRWEKSDNWFAKYESEFKQEYDTKNPFMKNIKQQSYAQALNQRPRDTTQKSTNGPIKEERRKFNNRGNRYPYQDQEYGNYRPQNRNPGENRNPYQDQEYGNYRPQNRNPGENRKPVQKTNNPPPGNRFRNQRNNYQPEFTNRNYGPINDFQRNEDMDSSLDQRRYQRNFETNRNGQPHFLEQEFQNIDTGWQQQRRKNPK